MISERCADTPGNESGHLINQPTRPSWVWTALAATVAAAAVALTLMAITHQIASDRPVGEGELFVKDGLEARARLEEMMPMYEAGEGIRHLRNQLRIEAISIISAEGTIIASTSANLVETPITNGLLLFGLESSRMTALARTLDNPISIDGVEEWVQGDVLYQVLQPLAEGAILLDYDISELLLRRARPAGIDSFTLQMLGSGALLLLMVAALLIGRSRVARRNREMFIEADLLQQHSRQLEATNEELRAARESAIEALALAEEKNRIRAEFVLMINHELRTPLTAIVTGAELLRSEEQLEPEERQPLIADMAAEGRRLESLIARMLEVARIENRGLSLALAPHSLRKICKAASDTNPRMALAEENQSADRSVWTNAANLIQLIGSLADNALTHGAQNVTLKCSAVMPIIPAVEVGSRPADPVFFVVEDDGPGIEPDFLPRVFEKFEKKSFSPGTGLGLYLAAMIAEALGASLAVAASASGTTMVIAVPTAQVAEVEDVA